jgi:membrane protein YqaA with SNARE-associated domain
MESLKIYLLALGLPGLFLIAFFDSAGVPLPGGVDVVVMLLAWRHPSLFPAVALTAAVGSTIGCWILFRIGQRGGRIAARGVESGKHRWISDRLHRNDVLAILFAMLSPPPFPTKVFVAVSGILRVRPGRFIATVLAGRLLRYLAEAYLAVRLGNKAAAVIQDHALVIAVALAGSLTLVALGRRLLRGQRAAARPEASLPTAAPAGPCPGTDRSQSAPPRPAGIER